MAPPFAVKQAKESRANMRQKVNLCCLGPAHMPFETGEFCGIGLTEERFRVALTLRESATFISCQCPGTRGREETFLSIDEIVYERYSENASPHFLVFSGDCRWAVEDSNNSDAFSGTFRFAACTGLKRWHAFSPMQKITSFAWTALPQVVCGKPSLTRFVGRWILRTPAASAKNPEVFVNAQTCVTLGKTAL